MLCYAMLCYAILCYVMLCYVMLCYVMLYYIILYYIILYYVMSQRSEALGRMPRGRQCYDIIILPLISMIYTYIYIYNI